MNGQIGSICAQVCRNKFICPKGRVLTCTRRRNVDVQIHVVKVCGYALFNRFGA